MTPPTSRPQLVECIPNVSTANSETIAAIRHALDNSPDTWTLHVDPGEAAGRTVFTFVTTLDSLPSAANGFFAAALAGIDMQAQRGVHPRIGAVDVFPVVPLGDLQPEAVRPVVDRVAEHLGERHALPLYMYESSARSSQRKHLATIRKGGYEGLPRKLTDPAWKPDFGPAHHNARAGATVMGVRDFLIAYNVNLAGDDVAAAKAIAAEIRTSGPAGPHRLPSLRAIGWLIEEYACAQVSMNLVNYRQTGLLAAFNAVSSRANAHGIATNGSELIGLVPRQALLDAAPGHRTYEEAVRVLGLDTLSPFLPEERVLEEKLMSLSGLSL